MCEKFELGYLTGPTFPNRSQLDENDIPEIDSFASPWRANLMTRSPLPADYVVDYSPLAQGKLVLHVINESVAPRQHMVHSLLRRLVRGIRRSPDWNDREAELAWAAIDERWGDVSSETIVQFLREKFAHDHLRKFEYAFQARCLAELNTPCATILDMGGGSSYSTVVPLLFRFPEASIWSMDVQEHRGASKYGIRYLTGDCTKSGLTDESVDVVCLISTLEHVGLGRYGDPQDVHGDMRAMQEARRVLKTKGYLILTVPYGHPTVVYNLHRVYDSGRLGMLSAGFETIHIEYTLMGKACPRQDVEDRKVTRNIPGFYTDTPDDKRIPEAPGGVLALLRKT
jgi:SAM-dependent methyltransferase